MIIKSFFLINFLLVSYFLQSQFVAITGKIIEQKNNIISIGNANVLFKQKRLITHFTRSNDFGNFKVDLIQNEFYEINVSCIGFYSYVDSFFANTNTKPFVIKLRENVSVYDTIRVEVKRDIYRKGDTTTFNIEAFKKNDENNLGDLLKSIPHFNVLPNGQIMVDGKMVSRILFEGKDVVGSDYEKIVQNFSPHQLDKIEFIENYKDPFDFSGKKNENVLNLKFKKKSIVKSVKVTLGLGSLKNLHDDNFDIFLDSKKMNSLHLFNFNTVGKLSNDLLNINKIYEQPSVSNTVKSKINTNFNSFSSGLNHQVFANNNTIFFDNNFNFTIKKKIINKLQLVIIKDRKILNSNTVTRNFNDSLLLNTLEDSRINNSKSYLYYLKNEVSFQKSNKSKLAVNFSALFSNSNNNNTAIINQNFSNLLENKNQYKLNVNIEKSFLINQKNIFSLVYLFEKNKLISELTNNGIKYINSILPSSFGIADSVWQPSIYYLNNNGFKTNYLIRSAKNNLDFNLGGLVNMGKTNFNSDLNARFNNNYLKNINGFTSDVTLNQVYIAFPLGVSNKTKKQNWNINLEPYRLLQYTIFKNKINYGININGSFSYKLNRNKTLYLNLNSSNAQSSIFDVAESRYLKNYKDIFQANSNFNVPKFSVANISFYNTPYSNKKLSTTINLLHIIATEGLLYNTNYNNGYSNITINNIVKNNTTTSLNIKNIIYELNKNAKIEIENSFSSTNYFNEQISIISKFNSKSYKNTLQYNTKIIKNISLTIQNELHINISKKVNSPVRYKNQSNITNLNLKYNFKKSTHMKLEVLNFYNTNKSQSIKINELLLNLDFKQIVKGNKIRIGVYINNLLDNTSYSSESRTPLQFSSDLTPLIRRYVLLKIEFLL
jgi:hypothetical protein